MALRAAHAKPALEQPRRVPVCRLREVPDKGFLERAISWRVRRGPQIENVARKVFVARQGGEVVVFDSRCPHLGCPVEHDRDSVEKPFVCPCHDGAFRADGSVIEGPPKRGLDRLEVVVPATPDGMVEVVLS
ncbi:MAG: Rieske (2Fe-2S) protein [Planctomycetes bacterium]|nr:Rieske (2Fe-2S) protein [Planctomycetota bacterium]